MSVNKNSALVPANPNRVSSVFGIKYLLHGKAYNQLVEAQLRCVDRHGQSVAVRTNQLGVFRFLYDCIAGNVILRGISMPFVSKLAGRFLDSSVSRCLISSFIRRNDIDMSEYEAGPFDNFNDFFCRNILDGVRSIDSEPASVISPCDGKVQVFSIGEDSCFKIKGIDYTIEGLLRDHELAKRYQGGTLILLRLGVDDYHRYIYPINGRQTFSMRINGRLHTVNPFAASRRPIYSENSREYAIIETETMGKVLMMEVGALMVGRITNHHLNGYVTRGEEKGFFKFGASSIVLCFEKDAIIPDQDIVKNSDNGAETLIKLGERIALDSTFSD